MEKKALRRNLPGFLAVLCALSLATMLGIASHPATAMAEETGVAHSVDADGTRHDYASVNEAKEAGYSGATIYMDADWDLGSNKLEVADSKSLTIDMCGHKITSSNSDATIYLNEHASVKITSSAEAREFKYQGFNSKTTERTECTISTPGLIVNTSSESVTGEGIHMEASSTLTLEKIAVAGCGAGGIGASKNCTVSLSHATLCHNTTYNANGGGIALGSGSKLSMAASHVDDNYGYLGGGVYCAESVTVTMEEGSTVSRNTAAAGGGFYFWKSFFSLKSSDGTGVIADNKGDANSLGSYGYNQSGGGIHVDGASGENEGLIEGVTISGNYAARDGGGVELDQRWTTVKNCTITGNWADYDGGGAYVNGGNCTFENCAVTSNYCAGNGGNYEGGGIFVSYRYDVKLSGTCTIKNNTRGKGSDSADDVFLSTITGGAGKAYITGNLSEGSYVGVRTGINGQRRIAKNFTYPSSKNCLFADLYQYYVSYGTDEGGDAWQRNGTPEYTVRVNGANAVKRKAGSTVTASAPDAGAGKSFWYWDADATKGLESVETYINDSTRFNSSLTFKMARNDVDLSAVYADTVTKASIDLGTPAGGSFLPATTSLTRTDGKTSGGAGSASATVTWYEVVNGERVATVGRAWPEATYVAVVSVPQSTEDGRFFDSGIGAGDITVQGGTVMSAKVDPTTGTLVVEIELKATSGTEPTKTDEAIVKLEKQDILGGSEAAVATFSLESDDQADDPDSLGKVTVKYTYDDEKDEITFSAPYKQGYNFCNWEGTGSEGIDDTPTVKLPVSKLLEIGNTLTAVYTPMVTEVEVGLAAPKAGGELAKTAKDVELTGFDGSFESLADAFDCEGGFEVTWSPEAEDEDGKAGYSTAYTAMVKITDGAKDLSGVEKAIASNAVIKASDGTEATSACFTVVDGALYLSVTFPATADVKVTGIEAPADVELTFDEAAAYSAEQASHPDTLCWPLPGTVTVTLENGEVVDGDVDWDIPAGFNAEATTSQEITVKGTVRIAYPDGVNVNDVSLEVSTTIKIAAPENSDDSKDDEQKDDDKKSDDKKSDGQNSGNQGNGNQNSGNQNGGTRGNASQAGAKAAKKGTPSTGDVAFSAGGALLAASAICLAAALVWRRQR